MESLDILWESLRTLESTQSPSLAPRRHPSHPPALPELLGAMKHCLARAWHRHHPLPKTPFELQATWEAPPVSDRARALRSAVVRQMDTIRALQSATPDQVRWTSIQEALPEYDAAVLYFFDIVGTHPGTFKGVEDGAQTFVSDLGSGFLSGDVTHWMPRPSLPDPRAS